MKVRAHAALSAKGKLEPFEYDRVMWRPAGSMEESLAVTMA